MHDEDIYAADVSPDEAPTPRPPGDAETGRPAAEDRSFLPGTRFGPRYRIIELLGRGGMGEVYRADDLQLGQPVALKFLPPRLIDDPAALARLRNEVRLARQVSHPNVCRVYDLSEVDGRPFLSMEYVDGEDLRSVLRRLGRPAPEKAVEIAHQLCAGLAAAHDRGVLHRDLKPANVMVDGRGHVRITDFGVAALIRELRGDESPSGTPAYMAPELFRGGGASPRSDIYSLGLLLYELFTGRPAFPTGSLPDLVRFQDPPTPEHPSALVPDLDPAVERTILSCLEIDPSARPATAAAAAAQLPCCDPLAAALEAGETPLPEIVAAAGPRGVLRPAAVAACLAAIVVALAVLGLLARRTTIYGIVPLERSKAVLEDRAREIARRLGYTDPPADTWGSLSVHEPAWQYFARQDRSSGRWDPLRDPGQIGLVFGYRQSPRHLVPENISSRIDFYSPYPAEGNVNLSMGLEGRLLRLEVTPTFVDHSEEPHDPVDWSLLFAAAGLEMEDFRPIEPRVRPRAHADEAAAWEGVLPHRDNIPVRVEATALDGRPVFFETVTPYDPFWSPETAAAMETPLSTRIRVTISQVLFLLVSIVAALLAIRNRRLGRGDPRGAQRLAILVLGLYLARWLLGGHHVPSLGGEFYMLLVNLGGGLLLAGVTWLLYMALEPYFRRLWPESLISWSRLLTGRPADPLVGRDLLIGTGFGIVLTLVDHLVPLAMVRLGLPPPWPLSGPVEALHGGREALAVLFGIPMQALAESLGIAFLFLLLRMILRRQAPAAAAFGLFFAAIYALYLTADPSGANLPANAVVGSVYGLVVAGLLIVLLVRFGLLATAAAVATSFLLTVFPISLEPAAPYFGTVVAAWLVVLAVASFAAWTSLDRRLAARDTLLEIGS